MQAEQEIQFFDRPVFELPDQAKSRQSPRYLFFAGNVVDPERAHELDYLRGGGLEVDNPCLKLTRKFIRRGRVTPLLENTHDPLPRELADDKNSDVIPLVNPQSPPDGAGAEFIPNAGPLVGWRAYPGDQVELIIGRSPNIDKGIPRGIVEIRALSGYDYSPKLLGNGIYFDSDIWQIQKAIFPDYPSLPVLLSDLKGLVETARKESSGDLKKIAEDMLMSCEQFERWARTSIERVHRLMRKGANDAGDVTVYSGTEIVLMEQLGIPRQDEEMKRLAASTRETMQVLDKVGARDDAAVLTLVKEVVGAFTQKSAEDREAFLAAVKELKQAESPKAEEKKSTKKTGDA